MLLSKISAGLTNSIPINLPLPSTSLITCHLKIPTVDVSDARHAFFPIINLYSAYSCFSSQVLVCTKKFVCWNLRTIMLLPPGYLGLFAWCLFYGLPLLCLSSLHLWKVGWHTAPQSLLNSFVLPTCMLLLQYLFQFGAKEFEAMKILSSNMAWIWLHYQRYRFQLLWKHNTWNFKQLGVC